MAKQPHRELNLSPDVGRFPCLLPYVLLHQTIPLDLTLSLRLGLPFICSLRHSWNHSWDPIAVPLKVISIAPRPLSQHMQ